MAVNAKTLLETLEHLDGQKPDADLVAEWAAHNARRNASRHPGQPHYPGPVALPPRESENETAKIDQENVVLASQLDNQPAGVQDQIRKAWRDWQEAAQDAKEQISGNAASWTWLHCHLAKLERERDLAVKEILRQHYLNTVQIYALAKVPDVPDDAAALALRQEIERLEKATCNLATA